MNKLLRFGDDRDWFLQARFGLFIHWGIYAVAGWHEQHIFRKHMTRAAYTPLMQRFNPAKFDPDEWLDMAEAAGMRYLCFTTKHIDGFCLWDSALTDFKITRTPYGKDALALLAEACHRRNMPLCLYYSVVDDHQPNYPHAGRSYELPSPQPGDQPDVDKYMQYLKGQIRELCTNYGKIHGFWWDGNVLKLRDPSVNTLIRELQPGIVINNRGMDEGDFGTPERDWDESVNSELAFTRPIEACQSIGHQSWSWRKNEDYYSDAHLIGSIQKVLAKGGNYLLNVGPKADGTFPLEAKRILARIGAWYETVKEALLDVAPANELLSEHDVLLTRRDNILYVHLHRQPIKNAVYLHPIVDRPRRAIILNTGRAAHVDVLDLPWLHSKTPNHCLCINRLPVNKQSLVGWVIKLEFERLPTGGQVVDTPADIDAEIQTPKVHPAAVPIRR